MQNKSCQSHDVKLVVEIQNMGTLSFQNGKFTFRPINLDEIDDANNSGLQQLEGSLHWQTRSPLKAVKLRRYADKSADLKLKSHFITDLCPPEQIPYPDDKEPRSWQIESAWWALTRTPCYIADEAGMGKTISSCLCMNAVPGKILILCPAFLKYNWQKEIAQWVEYEYTISIIENGNEPESSFDSDIVIFPDSLLGKEPAYSELRKRHFTWLFVDEAHRFKEATTQRTQKLLGDEKVNGITSIAERVVFLSGTPIPNGRPIEIYPLVSKCAPQAIHHRNSEEFGKQFCAGRKVTRFEGRTAITNWDFRGSSNLTILKQELQEKFMIRHLKRDHLKELGEKTRQIIFLDTPKQIQKFEHDVLDEIDLDELLGEDHCLGDIAEYRRKVGEAKLEPSFQFIKEFLDNTSEKLVVFAHHIDVVEGLFKMLHGYYALMIRGGMKASLKDNHVAEFQNNPNARVIVGNIDAMGVGLTLTAASRVIIVEPSWVPGVNEQAEDRCHRMTQESNVYIQYLVLRNSLDERMIHQVLRKEKNIHKLMS